MGHVDMSSDHRPNEGTEKQMVTPYDAEAPSIQSGLSPPQTQRLQLAVPRVISS